MHFVSKVLMREETCAKEEGLGNEFDLCGSFLSSVSHQGSGLGPVLPSPQEETHSETLFPHNNRTRPVVSFFLLCTRLQFARIMKCKCKLNE